MENKIDINGFDNYQITNDGRVYNKKYNRYLKPGLNNTGYLSVKLSDNGLQKTYPIHRLVAIHFLDKGDYNVVNHKDGNKINNNVYNLEWVTYQHNAIHAIDNGLNNPGDYCKIKVINIKTGDIFQSIEEASISSSYSASHLRSMIRGYYSKDKPCINKTDFRYL